MDQKLESFAAECHRILKSDSGLSGIEAVSKKLEPLLLDADFIATHLGPDNDSQRTVLYEDSELGFCILAHVFKGASSAPPHDHGVAWAIYGQATEFTDMSEWERKDEGGQEGHAELERRKEYRLDPAHAGLYDIGEIHSINPALNARYVRVTGTDLTRIQRLRFDPDAKQVRVGHPNG